MNTKKAIKILRELTTQNNFLAIEGIIELLQESKIIVTLEKLDRRLRKVEKLADDNRCSLEYIMNFYEEHNQKPTINADKLCKELKDFHEKLLKKYFPIDDDNDLEYIEKWVNFRTNGVDDLTYNGKPISEIKVGGID